MESKSIPIKKYILKYGLIYGLLTILFGLYTYLTGDYAKQNLFHASVLSLITISSIITAIISFKKSNDNFINLKEALKIGIGVAILGGLIAVLWKLILIKVIDPGIITELGDKQIKIIAENATDFTQENIDRKIAITKKYTSPLIQIVAAIGVNLFMGFLFSLIGGLIVQKKRDPFK
ncbi:DUF4199 domain-containing protein [Aquimarina sp. 433]